MKRNYWWLMVVILFVAVFMVSNLLVHAKGNVTKMQWEYKIVNTRFKDSIEQQLKQDMSMLNEHGKDGWELCGVNNTFYYFKKEITK